MLKMIFYSLLAGAGAGIVLSFIFYFLTRKKAKDAFIMPTVIIGFLGLIAYMVYGFMEEGFWEGLLVVILSVIPAGAGVYVSTAIAWAILNPGKDEEDSTPTKAKPARTPDPRYFHVTKEETIKNLQYECERTEKLFKKSQYISRDYHEGADEILVQMKHYVDLLSKMADRVEFLHKSDDTIVMNLNWTLNGKQHNLNFISCAWYRDADNNQHRLCSFKEGGYDLTYDMVSNDHGCIWEWTDYDKVITARYDYGVTVKRK